MEIIWVLENVLKKRSFYNIPRVLLLVASVSLWRKYHPHHKTVLYCDEPTYQFLEEFNLLKLWDIIRSLSYPEKIDKIAFWSSCKTKIISETKIPLVVVDHDFLIFKNIDNILESNKVTYTYDEYGWNWYPKVDCEYNRKLSTPIKHSPYAANVSLFYLPNPKFANEYGKQTLKNHEELTSMGCKQTEFMIFSEQYMLKEWLVSRNIPHQTLNAHLFDNTKMKYSDEIHNIGVWSNKEASLSYKHYGVEEKYLTPEDCQYLIRCINAGKRVNGNKLLKSLLDEGYSYKLDLTLSGKG